MLSHTAAETMCYRQENPLAAVADPARGHGNAVGIGGVCFNVTAHDGRILRMLCQQHPHGGLLAGGGFAKTYPSRMIDKNVARQVVFPASCRGPQTKVIFLEIGR